MTWDRRLVEHARDLAYHYRPVSDPADHDDRDIDAIRERQHDWLGGKTVPGPQRASHRALRVLAASADR